MIAKSGACSMTSAITAACGAVFERVSPYAAKRNGSAPAGAVTNEPVGLVSVFETTRYWNDDDGERPVTVALKRLNCTLVPFTDWSKLPAPYSRRCAPLLEPPSQ